MATQMRPVPPVLPEPHARLSKVRTDLKKSSPSHMQPASVQGSLGRADWRPAKGTPPTKPGRRGPRPGSALRCAQRQRARLGKFPIASRARIFSWPRPGCALRCAQRRRARLGAQRRCRAAARSPETGPARAWPGGSPQRPGSASPGPRAKAGPRGSPAASCAAASSRAAPPRHRVGIGGRAARGGEAVGVCGCGICARSRKSIPQGHTAATALARFQRDSPAQGRFRCPSF